MEFTNLLVIMVVAFLAPPVVYALPVVRVDEPVAISHSELVLKDNDRGPPPASALRRLAP